MSVLCNTFSTKLIYAFFFVVFEVPVFSKVNSKVAVKCSRVNNLTVSIFLLCNLNAMNRMDAISAVVLF